MADRRMFTKKITDGDEFTSMPPTAQCLYFHLCMSADDDGFSNNIRIAMFNAHATTDDFNILVGKRFIIPFESGVIVIKHWKMHNYIQNDRYHETKFIEEKSTLLLKENGVYTVSDSTCIHSVSRLDTEVRLDKDSSIGEDSKGKSNKKTNKTVFVPPTVEEVKSYCDKRGNSIDPEEFVDFYTSKGWIVGRTKMTDWQAAVRTWERNANKKSTGKKKSQLDEWAELLEAEKESAKWD